ncbi:MAG: FAD/NAD(P)-binding protein [Pseudoxanthomonas sp.]
MNDTRHDGVFDLAIIGGGAAGTMVAIQALRQAHAPLRIALVDPASALGQGVAYSTRHPEHLLNVPVRRMSAFDDAPEDFLDFIASDGGDRESLGPQFVQRHRYADYLETRLREARAASRAELVVLASRAVALDDDGATSRLTLEDGTRLSARGVVLAVGNAPRSLPASVGDLPADRLRSAWDYDAVKRIPIDAEVCIVGSGLSMVDAVLSLAANGHRGGIHIVSRHALLPLPHAPHAAAGIDVDALLRQPLRQRLHMLRAAARDAARAGTPWQAVMESLRPHGQALWRSLSAADQRRFLRHVVRYWDVHRHRVAAQVYAQLQALVESGRIRLHRGRVREAAMAGPRVRIDARMRDGRDDRFDVDAVVNATGMETRARAMGNPLLSDLLDKGLAVAGAHGIGIRTDDEGHMVDARGQPRPNLLALGSLRIGDLWESTAVPELRGQAEAAARASLGRVAAQPGTP